MFQMMYSFTIGLEWSKEEAMQIQPFGIQPISSVQPMKRENNKRNDDNNKQKKENNFKETLDKAMKR